MNNLSATQKNLRNEDVGAGGFLKGLELDSNIAQVRMQSLIQERTRIVDTVTNALKSQAESIQNSIRRMV
jgi:hypothetical protein